MRAWGFASFARICGSSESYPFQRKEKEFGGFFAVSSPPAPGGFSIWRCQVGGKADRLRSLLRKGDPIVDQAQRNSLSAEEVLTEIEEREGREEARGQRTRAGRR